jgi:plasmid stabilization system protein ParE
MSYRVVFSPEAEEQLAALYGYIAAAASPDIAARYTEAIVSYCESLRTFPHRGTMRDDVRPGLRCVFHANWTPIPRQTGHSFHVNLDSRSVATRG